MGAWAYSYDELNRLVSGYASGGTYATQSPFACWSYDDFGNRTHQALSQGALSPECITGSPSTTQDTASTFSGNRIVQTLLHGNPTPVVPTYDNAGDVLTDATNTFVYDAEGRICAVHGTTGMTGYQYNADGLRIGKGIITSMTCDVATNGYQPTNDYVLNLDGSQMTEMAVGQNAAPTWQHTNVKAGGTLIATYDTTGLHYYFDDALGSRRVQTDGSGNVEQTCNSLPFGDGLDCSQSTTSPTEHHFTGKERDSESGLDYFGARYYASSMGRWMSPDWADKPETVPYSSLDNPQSLNLYGYVLNNPLSRADPDGHAGCPPDCGSSGNQVADFVVGLANAWGSDNVLGAGRMNIPTTGGRLGSGVGDAIATAQGAGEVVLGTLGNIGGLALDATGVGALVGVPANVVSTAVTIDGAAVATTAVVAMAKGSYTNTHESGMTYDGKGGPDRAAKSGARVEKETGDKHVSTDHKPSSSDREGFKDESRRLDSHGGAKSDTNHNKIDSPGKKYREQDGSH